MEEKLNQLRNLLPRECDFEQRETEVVIKRMGVPYLLKFRVLEQRDMRDVAARYNEWWETRSRAAAKLNI